MYSVLAIIVWVVQLSLLIYTLSALYPHFNILKFFNMNVNFRQHIMNNKKKKSELYQFILNFLAVALSIMLFYIAFDSFMGTINELKNDSKTAFLLGFAVTFFILVIEKTKDNKNYAYISPVFISFTVMILLPAFGSDWNSEPMVAGGIGKVLALFIIILLYKKQLDEEILLEEKNKKKNMRKVRKK